MAMKKIAAALALTASLAACDDEVTDPSDNIPPLIEIERPAENDQVSSQPSFLIQAEDDESGIACSTIEATIGGSDVSTFFRSGCNFASGEIRVPGGQIILTEGQNRLIFRISDGAGNEGLETRNFVVVAGNGGGNGPPEN